MPHQVQFDASTLSFPVADYVEQRLPGHFDQATQSELTGVCLWHTERKPSLYVNVDTGMYFCHSCNARGNLVRLVQRVGQFASYTDAEEWLLDHYGPDGDDDSRPFHLRFNCKIDVGEPDYVDESVVQQYTTYDDMLLFYMVIERGLPLSVIKMFDIGYCPQYNSVAIPWRNRQGRLLTVKHRLIGKKQFFYEPRCTALRSHLWGLERARHYSIVYICEAEIDAMTLWAADKPALAIGGSHFSVEQAQQLRLAGVQAVVPVCDRDKAGEDANRLITERLKHTDIDVYSAVWPVTDAKDCNALGVDGCREITYTRPKLFF